MLSRYANVATLTQDSARFTSTGRVVNEILRLFSEQELGRVELLVRHYSLGLINSNLPDPTRQRKLVQNTSVPRLLERLRPFIQRIIDELLDQAQWKGRIEVIGDFSFLFPITVIAELHGIPVEIREQLKVGLRNHPVHFHAPALAVGCGETARCVAGASRVLQRCVSQPTRLSERRFDQRAGRRQRRGIQAHRG